jgi:polyisoprenoid-binding protein YceI
VCTPRSRTCGSLTEAIVAVAAGPWVYRDFIAGDADPELTLPGQTQAATTEVNGTWSVVPGPNDTAKRTQAGYRVDEILRGLPITVNGRAPKVTGEVVVAESKMQSGTFTIDVASITSPESARDNQFRGEDLLDAGKFPTAELSVIQPVDVAAVPESGEATTLDVPVSLTIKGVSRDVTVKVTPNVPATPSSPPDPFRSPGWTSTSIHRISPAS